MPRTSFSNSELATLLGSPAWVRCEQLIRQFEQAWRVGPDPAIGDYLRVEGRERRALLVELVHIDLEFRIKSGQATRVESYLSDHPELASDRSLTLDLLAAEYDFRRRHQGAVSTE